MSDPKTLNPDDYTASLADQERFYRDACKATGLDPDGPVAPLVFSLAGEESNGFGWSEIWWHWLTLTDFLEAVDKARGVSP